MFFLKIIHRARRIKFSYSSWCSFKIVDFFAPSLDTMKKRLKIVPRQKVALAEKNAILKALPIKSQPKVWKIFSQGPKKFWKKNIDENFFSPKVLGLRGRKCFQPLICFFQKSRQFRSKSEFNDEKKTRKQFFPQKLSLDTWDRLYKFMPIFCGNC